MFGACKNFGLGTCTVELDCYQLVGLRRTLVEGLHNSNTTLNEGSIGHNGNACWASAEDPNYIQTTAYVIQIGTIGTIDSTMLGRE